MALTGKEKLVTVCGLYCDKCAIHNGEIENAAQTLIELLHAHGISKEMMAMVPGTDWYKDFEKGIAWCRDDVKCGGCRAGERFNPMCELRKCCVDDKGLDFCFDCGEFPCETVNRFEQNFFPCIEKLKDIKESGVGDWIRRQEAG